MDVCQRHSKIKGVLHLLLCGYPSQGCNAAQGSVQRLLWMQLVLPPRGTVKYCVTTPFPDRTDEEALKDMTDACNTGATVHGVKGPSPLINLPGFSPIWSWCPDYMHSVLLGVARQITDLWFTATGTDYYCGKASKMAIVDKRILSLKLPECINRRPRALLARKYWKASEWQCWLLYHSMPCLADVLEGRYLHHWSLLVSGVFLLLRNSVTKADVDQSTRLLTEFVVNVQFLYGKSAMTYNVHQLLHIPKSVLLFGPLWTHSCFVFENNIGKLLRLVTSSNGVAIQIATRLLLHSSLICLKALASSHALSLIAQKVSEAGEESIVPLGKPEIIDQSFHSKYLQGSETAVEYKRLKVRGAVFASEKYMRHTKIDCTAVALPDGTYMKTKRIILCRGLAGEEEFFLLSHVYVTSSTVKSAHIKRARRQEQEMLRKIDVRARPCIYFSLDGQEFFCDLVNSYEWS
ncbi:uncharacterized protein LOC119445535 isoform X2 [Dermacentor silvarum]|uniref:uncharacterized protein LOC119445535 isoform X2 n=1 Tax=Dermacentor silvarum TaxID=543639 RepID=UPI0021017814|nr:uncharacterized protein LOC119445535 isoform X2 [Dermacentor silvarum]